MVFALWKLVYVVEDEYGIVGKDMAQVRTLLRSYMAFESPTPSKEEGDKLYCEDLEAS